MKKYFFTAVPALTIAASGYTYMQNQKTIALNDLALENVEALANIEDRNEQCPNTGSSCSFVVSTPGGNWIETHYGYRS